MVVAMYGPLSILDLCSLEEDRLRQFPAGQPGTEGAGVDSAGHSRNTLAGYDQHAICRGDAECPFTT